MTHPLLTTEQRKQERALALTIWLDALLIVPYGIVSIWVGSLDAQRAAAWRSVNDRDRLFAADATPDPSRPYRGLRLWHRQIGAGPVRRGGVSASARGGIRCLARFPHGA